MRSAKRQKRQKQSRKQSEIAKEEAKLRDQLESRHGKLLILESMVRADPFTYELQRFFSETRDANILFEGFLEDIEKFEGGAIAEFSAVLGENTALSPTDIIFRLKVKDEQISALLQGERPGKLFRSWRFIFGPTYIVVARIESVSRIRRYEFESRGHVEEPSGEVDVDVPLKFLAHGSLLEAVETQARDTGMGIP